jgi:hypothetical protein
VSADPSRADDGRTIWEMQREIRMEATRKMKLDTLKARIGSSDYEVDADAVAEAIVRRLLTARRNAAQGNADGTGPAGPPLEAA